MAMNSISGVMMPWRAQYNCVTALPSFARSGLRWSAGGMEASLRPGMGL